MENETSENAPADSVVPAVTPVATKKKHTLAGWIGLGILLLIVGGCSAVLAVGNHSSSSSGSTKDGAFEMCKQFLTPKLVSPSTAHYRDFFGNQAPTVVSEGGHEYDVQSTVDSQNGFGAEVRGSFDCDVTNTSGINWQLNKLILTNPDGSTQNLT